MPAPGRAPKPAALKIASGNPSRRPIIRGADYPRGLPDPPPDIMADPEALAEWQHMIGLVGAHADLVRKSDRNCLAAYCFVWARFLRAIRHIREHGETETRIIGDGIETVCRSAESKLASELSRDLRQYFALFGISPADRSRVHSGDDDHDENEEDAARRLIGGTARSKRTG